MSSKKHITPRRPVPVGVSPEILLDHLASLCALLGLRLRWCARSRRLILEARP